MSATYSVQGAAAYGAQATYGTQAASAYGSPAATSYGSQAAPVGSYSSFVPPAGSFVASPQQYYQQQQPYGGYSAYNYGGTYGAPQSTPYVPAAGGSATYSAYPPAYAAGPATYAAPAATGSAATASAYAIPTSGSFTYNVPSTQPVPTSGSFTYTADPYAATGMGAGYGGNSVSYPYQGYGGTGYASLGGAGSCGGSMMQSTGSFTSTPQFAFYPETGGGGSCGTAFGTSHTPAPAGTASGNGVSSALTTSGASGPDASVGDAGAQHPGAGRGTSSQKKPFPPPAPGKAPVLSKKKKKACCC
mmetsp:Transcript_134544/g.335714  ORF Transcript_134544/g.335714 Transcript_134544/m.335714 type:complete len:303 (-) Transcript_134544:204-1112(-)